MSLLHDPFDLLQKGQKMDNVVPFLSHTKIDAMVNVALKSKQMPAKQKSYLFGGVINWRYGGAAIAACLALLLAVLPSTAPQISSTPSSEVIAQNNSGTESVKDMMEEYSELAMLDTLESY